MFATPRWDTEDGTAKVQRALSAFRQGRPVVVTDDVGRENEGDIFIPAESISEACMSFLLAHTSGITCVAMSGERLDELALPAMVPENANDEAMRTAFCVSVDARHGVTTGVSAADRAATVRALGRSGTTAADLVRPGHIFPLRARPNGVLERRGHTEAAYDLARMAGITPAIVLSELMNRDGTMMRTRAIRRFCDEHRLPIVSVEEIACWRRRHPRVTERASAEVQCNGGPARIVAFESESGYVHAALIIGQPMKRQAQPPLVRIHSECMTGDTLGSVRCDCGEQLRRSLQCIREDGHGILIYLRGQEGRGIGLVAKLRAYALQNSGLDTVDANTALGLPVDGRAYADAASILHAMGIGSIRLLTNNPDKVRQLRESDVVVEKVIPLTTPTNPFNIRYLVTKRDRMGHGLGDLAEISVPLG